MSTSQSPMVDVARNAAKEFKRRLSITSIGGGSSSPSNQGKNIGRKRFSSLFDFDAVTAIQTLDCRGRTPEFLNSVVLCQHDLITAGGEKVFLYIGFSGLSFSNLAIPYERLFAYSCDEQNELLFFTVIDETMHRKDYVFAVVSPKLQQKKVEYTAQDLIQGISLRIANCLALTKGLAESDAKKIAFKCSSPEAFETKVAEVLSTTATTTTTTTTTASPSIATISSSSSSSSLCEGAEISKLEKKSSRRFSFRRKSVTLQT